MSWFFIAISGHILNGGAFIVDKLLLQKAFKRSATYAGLVGILSFLSIIFFPWVTSWPSGVMLLVALCSGVTFIFALQYFFASLQQSEASRVVPIVGSLIPIFTLIGSLFFLHERLALNQGMGFMLLILATIILSGTGKKARPNWSAIRFAILSSILFAVSFVTGKVVYDASGFLGSFLITRLSAGITALFLITVLDRSAGQEIRSIFRPQKTKGQKGIAKHSAVLAIFGQSMGAVGFILVQLAISQGSASIVNALQASQYILIVLVAILFKKQAKTFLGKQLNSRILIAKISAIIIAGIGMALVV